MGSILWRQAAARSQVVQSPRRFVFGCTASALARLSPVLLTDVERLLCQRVDPADEVVVFCDDIGPSPRLMIRLGLLDPNWRTPF
ncbi:MAG: hypothetical protein FJ279_03290 [Planctomycetes bacterium]|nr:hypothetical protein [Planctomycetota bacterium]